MLRDLDFAPTQTRPDEIELHSCPFLEVADGPGSAACALHLGLMHGALEALDTGDELESLTPFAGPTRCVARLRTAA